MRKLLYILFVLISNSGINGQNYYPLVSDSSVWYYTWCIEACNTRILFTNGDTNLNDTSYFKCFGQEYTDGPIQTIGFLREDTLNKLVYLRDKAVGSSNNTEETIIYNFNLNETDSIFVICPTMYQWFDSLGWYIVDSVSIVSIDIGLRKIIYLSRTEKIPYDGYNYINWIEGLGYSNNPEFGEWYVDPNWLNCLYRGVVKEYNWNPWGEEFECIYTRTDIKIHENDNQNIQIYYDRELEEIYITKLETYNKIELYVRIFDISGHLIYQYITESDVIDLNISNFHNGIYFVSVISDDRLYSVKILK